MFGLGFWEIALILVVALLVFGPAKLPELARSLGRGLREFRKATDEFKSTIDTELHAPEPPRDRSVADTAKAATLPDTVARPAPFGVQPETEAEIETEAEVEDNHFEGEEAAAAAEEAARVAADADHASEPDPASSDDAESPASPGPAETTDTRNKA